MLFKLYIDQIYANSLIVDNPPSIFNVCPVIQLESSLTKYLTNEAISLASPIRFKGCLFDIASNFLED